VFVGSTQWLFFVFPLVAAAPWIAAIAWVIARTRSDSDVPPSLGEQLLKRF
jgi:hypothetical protein